MAPRYVRVVFANRSSVLSGAVDDGVIVIAKPKGRKTRTVPMPDTVSLALAEHLRHHPAEGDALVFTSREHKPLNRTYFN